MTYRINPFQKLFEGAIFASVSSFLFVSTALAGPNGGQIEAGTGSIAGQGTNNVIINQQSNRIVINWNSFNSGVNDSVEFKQPNANALAINRINNGTPTEILGSLRANGQVVVINPNGVVLGNQAKVDVNKLVVSTADVSTSSAMSDDKLVFDKPGNPNAKIVNNGTITAGEAGLVGFIAPQVENNGTINVKMGKAHLASGSTFTLDLAGDDLVNIAVSDDVVKQLALNSGRIKGNEIRVTAAQARNAVDKLIVNTGVIEATYVAQKGGKIILGGDSVNVVHTGLINASGKSGGTVQIKAKQALLDGVIAATGSNGDGGKVDVQATELLAVSNRSLIDVFGINPGQITMQSPWVYTAGTYLAQSDTQKGGKIKVLGDHLYLASSTYMNASGAAGGGHIYIGGDFQGHGDMHTATTTSIERGALIVNDALQNGDGGQTIVWANDTTEFFGKILARGKGSGKGGFTEVSGKERLNFQGIVDLTSESGVKGELLLDPATITVYGNFDPNFVSTDGTVNFSNNLKLWLDAADKSTITLKYSTDALSGATVTGSSGTNTIITSVNVASQLRVGARIRIGVSGAITTADTMGGDTYTIASISGTTITTVESLSTSYTNQTLNRGLVSQWIDKSSSVNHATQGTDNIMPLFVDNAINGHSTIGFNSDYMTTGALGVSGNSAMAAFLGIATYASTNGGGNDGGGSYFWDRAPAGNPLFDLKVVGGKYSLQRRYDNGSGLGGLNSTTNVSNLPTLLTIVRDPSVSMTIGVNGMQENSVVDSGASLTPDAFRFGAHNGGGGNLTADYMDMIFYNSNLTADMRALVDQYQSAKWNIDLNAPGTGGTENAKATSATGYNVFTTDYLEHLSQSADVNLLATNLITLDLKGDTINLANDRNISFTTINGNINSVSSGAIVTNRTGSGGNITFTAGGSGSIDIGNITLNAQNGGIVTANAGGNIFLGAITSGGVTAQSTGAGSRISTNAISVGSGNISLTADDVAINGNLSGTGTLTLQPYATNRVVNINYGVDNGSGFHLSTAEIGRLSEGWSSINLGRTNGGNDLFLGAATWTDPVHFRNAFRISAYGAQNGTDNASFVFGTAGGWTDLFATISTTGQTIDFTPSNYVWVGSTAGGTVTSNGGNILFSRIFSQNNGNMNINSAGGLINIADMIYGGAGAGRTYSFNAGAGNINFGNTINVAANVTVSAANITLSSAWGATTALGNVSLTAANGLSLPSIRAQTLFAQSGVGSNITLTGTLTALGSGNSVVLNSGQNFINSGDINPGSGRYLVYSANPAANTLGVLSGFTKRYNRTYAGYAPGSVTETGNVFLYSIAPTITVTANNATRVYGDADPSFSAVYSGFIDGDTALTALTGTPSISSGAVVTSGVGTYAITPSMGSLLSDLGYGFNFVNGSLSVTPASLTATADNKNKTAGTANPVFTVSLLGLRNSDLATLFTGYTISSPADASSPAGIYLISLVGGNAGPNYIVTNIDGHLTIDQAPDSQPNLPYKQLFDPEVNNQLIIREEKVVVALKNTCLYKIIDFDGSITMNNCAGAR